jgi:3-hydroxyisobutyrate dehydrogenase-like beta-hydroxyacid dehydrogenase
VVGILGLGRMGSVIARHIAAAGFRVQAYDPVAREEDFGPAGVELRSSEGGAVEGADVVLLIVGYDEEVKDIVSAPGFQASCRPGQVVAVMSTVRPSTMAEIAAALPAGVAAVDVPVCRGQVAADEGRLLALLGGAEADVQRCLPVLRAFCTDMEHVGDLGTGQVAKMANNVMLWSAYFGVFEAMQLMRGAGVDAERARQALRSSSADSWALSMWPNVRPVWAHDDLAIAKQVAAAVGVEVPVLSAVSEAFGRWPNPEEVYESRSQVH